MAFKDTMDKYGWDYEFFVYPGGHFDIAEPLAEAFKFIDGVWKEKLETQTIQVAPGWSLISSYLMPESPLVEDIFSVPVGNGDLLFALSKSGFYWPGENINTMNTWFTKQALKVKAAQNFDLDILGIPWQNRKVNLVSGFNYMPVLATEPVDAISILLQLGGDFLWAYDMTNALILWPAGGVFTLETLLPGAGYIVFTSASGSYDFGLQGKATHPEAAQKANIPDNSLNTGTQHIIMIPAEALSNLTPGTLFAIQHETGNISSVTRLTDNTLPLLLIANGDDPTTEAVDGFVANETMVIAISDANTQAFTALTPEFDEEVGLTDQFTEWGISKVASLKNTTGLSESPNDAVISIQPNPVTSISTIALRSSIAGNISIVLLDSRGLEVKTIANAFFDAGHHSLTFQTNDLAAGIYFCKLTIGTTTTFEKIVVIK
jgi:hypothetical protein